MKYVKGNQIFPHYLLKEIQKYIQGECVYIPQQTGKRKKWGEKSGHRKQLAQRNSEIRLKYSGGTTIEQLSAQYFLSQDTIKKIVYSNK